MVSDSLGTALQQVARLFATGTVAGMTDSQLIERFTGHRDELAFEALLARHGPMVLGICRRMLADAHDIEDAFQATFLVLVRRAHSLQRPDRLGPWLYGVAYRVAVRARARAARRRARERLGVEVAAVSSHRDAAVADMRRELDDEIERLPGTFRDALVLCYLQGMTHEQAAAQLGCPVGTVRSRLARGRDRLHTRLVRRGLAPTAGALAAALATEAASAAVPPALIRSTLQAAIRFAAGGALAGSIPAAVLAKGVLLAMTFSRIKLCVLAVLTAALVAGGAGVIIAQVGAPRPARPGPAPAAAAPAPGTVAPQGKTAVAAVAETPAILKYNDGQAEGKKSLGGSGEIIDFTLPAGGPKVAGLRIHGSRYGMPEAPDESFLIYFLNQDLSEVVSTQMAPYSLFERGEERWVEVTFPRPFEVPQQFCVALDFRATGTKGVYVSYDTSTRGKYTRTGLPGIKAKRPNLGGDWMIEVLLAK
jgi:RNA polymerase sigma factor (sigma-70 family)